MHFYTHKQDCRQLKTKNIVSRKTLYKQLKYLPSLVFTFSEQIVELLPELKRIVRTSQIDYTKESISLNENNPLRIFWKRYFLRG